MASATRRPLTESCRKICFDNGLVAQMKLHKVDKVGLGSRGTVKAESHNRWDALGRLSKRSYSLTMYNGEVEGPERVTRVQKNNATVSHGCRCRSGRPVSNKARYLTVTVVEIRAEQQSPVRRTTSVGEINLAR